MAAPYTYISQTDLEGYLGVILTAKGITQFNAMLPRMMVAVDQYCNRTWNFVNPAIETFDALANSGAQVYGNYTFFPKFIPISATPADANYPLAGGIISLVIGTSPIDLNYVVSYGTHLKIAAAFPSVLLANPLGMRLVKLTYNSDAAQNCPGDVQEALIEWIARKVQTSPDANKDPNKVQTGTVIAEFKSDHVGGLPDFVKLVLDQYRVPVLDHF